MTAPESKDPDSADVPAGPEQPAEPPMPEPERSGGSGWVAWLILIALLGAGGYYGYPYAKRQLEEVRGQRALLEHLDQDVNVLKRQVRELAQSQSQLGSRVDRSEEQLTRLSGDVSRVEMQVQGGRRGFQLAAIEQLLLAANDQLQLAGDVRAARLALEEAERRLSLMDDPILIPVRQALSSERAALASTPEADIAGPVIELAELIRQAPAWPLRARAPGQYEIASSDDSAPVEAGVLERLWSSVKRAVAGMFTIRRSEGPVPRLLPPGEEDLVTQAMSLKLEGLRLAVLSRDAVAVREMSRSAEAWIEAYYNTSDGAVARAVQRLQALREAAAGAAPLPDISGSLARLREAMEQRSVR